MIKPVIVCLNRVFRSLKKASAFLFFLSCWVFLSACDSEHDDSVSSDREKLTEQGAKPVPESGAGKDWSRLITHHTRGTISSTAAMDIHFNRDIVDDETVEQDASHFVHISPPVKAAIVFHTRRQIRIQPSSPLSSDTLYTVSVLPKKQYGLASSKPFVFNVRIIHQDFSVQVEPYIFDEATNTLRVQGTMTTADRLMQPGVSKVLTAEYQGQQLPVDWESDAARLNHRFQINGIKRLGQAQELLLEWDGEPINVDNNGRLVMEIPAINVFEVLAIKADSRNAQSIVITFSNRLDKTQNLDGLIRLGSKPFSSTIRGNKVTLFPAEPLTGLVNIDIDQAIVDELGQSLNESEKARLDFAPIKPELRFASKGNIVPDIERMTVPFSAVNVKAVYVHAMLVYDDNIGQFLQENTLDSAYNMQRVGRFVWQKKMPLSGAQQGHWHNYDLDIGPLIKQYPGALIRLSITTDREQVHYDCQGYQYDQPAKPVIFANQEAYNERENSAWDGIENNYVGYSYSDNQNPCKDSYYHHNKKVRADRNVMVSNIGLIAKRTMDNRLLAHAVDIKTSRPLAGVDIGVYNYQNQLIGSANTDHEGFASIVADSPGFYLLARYKGQRGYLKVNTASALSTSHFDVGGYKSKSGIDGFIYTERGVWRPGDDIHLVFVLSDKSKPIPDSHPVTATLISPAAQEIQRVVNTNPVNKFYRFKLSTDSSAPTGTWRVNVQVGGARFEKKLKIETVKPNRLKIELDFPQSLLKVQHFPQPIKLHSQWLHGAKASALKSLVQVTATTQKTRFGRYSDFEFDDPVRKLRFNEATVFDGHLDEDGNAEFTIDNLEHAGAPGMMALHFSSRVFERGGDFSINYRTMDYSPYEIYLGIKLPKGDAARNMLLTDTLHPVTIAAVDGDGNPISADNIQVEIFKIDWRWWWDKSGDNLARYASSRYRRSIASAVIAAKNGKAQWQFSIKYPDWGRYMVRACVGDNGHCSGRIVYIDWPGWAGRAQEQGGPGANALTLTADKPVYSPGESARIALPQMQTGRALVSIENDHGVLKQYWHVFSGEEQSKIELPIEGNMAPNVYVNITLLQVFEKTNDRPVRMYGIVPIKVDDPETYLRPELILPTTVKPKSTYNIMVKEGKGLPMTYTLAIVDEGLLGLTGFNTPDPHGHFYRRKALGVLTFDMFDSVIGAYGGEIERILSLGGDGSRRGDKNRQKKRFPPVVEFIGPVSIMAGETHQHKVSMPSYLGAVRVMVVAAHGNKYGTTSGEIVVKEPLTLLPSVPRVIGPKETIDLPFSIFVQDSAIKHVEVSLLTDKLIEGDGKAMTSVQFAEPSEQIGKFSITTGDTLGQTRLRLIARTEQYVSEQSIDLDLRSPNTERYRFFNTELLPGASWSKSLQPFGMDNTNKMAMEVSSIPPLQFEHRLSYLKSYPHGCVEQTTSAAFPQIYLPLFAALSPEENKKTDQHVNVALQRLQSYQNSDGGFSYWPVAGHRLHSWASSYAGHFMIAAKNAGFPVDEGLLTRWLEGQKKRANGFVTGTQSDWVDQNYRLFTLALAGYPELGAMNRARTKAQPPVAAWLLASAYSLAGQGDAGKQLIESAGKGIGAYKTAGNTLGSVLRDEAILLLAMTLTGQKQAAVEQLKKVAEGLSSGDWQSTQAIAFSLMAIAQYESLYGTKAPFSFEYALGADAQSVHTQALIHPLHFTLDDEQQTALMLKNNSQIPLFVTISQQGVPGPGEERPSQRHLSLSVRYLDRDGNSLAPGKIRQGTDLTIETRIKNTSSMQLDNLALTHILPSGWELINDRLAGESVAGFRERYDYRDYRDDRVYTYFALPPGASRTYTTRVNATYPGRFYLPGISVEAMYDAQKHAATEGQWVEVHP